MATHNFFFMVLNEKKKKKDHAVLLELYEKTRGGLSWAGWNQDDLCDSSGSNRDIICDADGFVTKM